MSWLSDIFNPGHPAADAANQQIQLMEQQQQKHDTAVGQGKTAIDKAFSQFTPDYFNNYAQTYRDAYNPQLTDQYNVAKDKMVATLAGNDQLEGSTGAYTLGQLDKTYGTQQADIANKSQDAANTLRGTVNNAKTQLYGLNTTAADPLTMASQAQESAGAIVAPQSYPSLSNVFGDALNSVATGVRANQYSMNPYQFNFNAAPIGQGGSQVNSY